VCVGAWASWSRPGKNTVPTLQGKLSNLNLKFKFKLQVELGPFGGRPQSAAMPGFTVPTRSVVPIPPEPDSITVMIDNFDSFTYNIVQYLEELGASVRVFRHDAITVAQLEALSPRRIVISPGPGAPRDAGVSSDVIRAFGGRVPILGVCLGLQCMYEVFGGTVTSAGEIMHGKTSPIAHDGRGVFKGLPSPFQAVRYHSLAGTLDTLPACLEVTATSPGGVIQGVRHREWALEGVQFHPESILTEHGHAMLRNFLMWGSGRREE
jgi:anthranilate synthase/aminodeoxychorismate synthase-like glutamine amidotransferase